MQKVVRWDDNNAITLNHLHMPDYVMAPNDVALLDEAISGKR
jgi:hypothetical protein